MLIFNTGMIRTVNKKQIITDIIIILLLMLLIGCISQEELQGLDGGKSGAEGLIPLKQDAELIAALPKGIFKYNPMCRPLVKPTMEVNTSLSQINQTIVYRVIPPRDYETEIMRIHTQLKLLKKFKITMCHDDKKGYCREYRSGTFEDDLDINDYLLQFYPLSGNFVLSRPYFSRGNIIRDPSNEFFFRENRIHSEDDALEVAKKHLLNWDLLPDDGEIMMNKVSFQDCDYNFLEKKGKISQECVVISFRRKINGFLISPDRILIEMSLDGTVLHLEYNWRKLEPYAVAELISSNQVLKKLETEEKWGVCKRNENMTFIITTNFLLYPGDSIHVEQDYLFPHWSFSGTLNGESFGIYYPAING